MADRRLAVAVAPARTPDLDSVVALYTGCLGASWSRNDVAGVLAMPGAFALLARCGPTPAGFVLCRAAGRETTMLSLAVDRRFRRRGIGRELVERALASAWAAGAAAMVLEVAEDNHAARALYGATGFARVGRRPGYYRLPGGAAVAALVLRRDLSPHALRSISK